MAQPNVKVEIAFATQPDDPAPVWTDVTQWVDLPSSIRITRGRPDEFGTVQAGTAAFTLNNSDGRFTAGLSTSPYYPNVKIRKKVRISSTVGGITYYRFTGYIDEWPVEWPGGGSYAEAQITATDRFKRLGNLASFRSVIEEEYLFDSPFAYYTLGDAAGTVQAGDTSGNGRAGIKSTQLGTGGTLTFGAATGPATDALTALQLVPVDSSNGRYLAGTWADGMSPNSPTGQSIECFFLTSTVALQGLVAVTALGTNAILLRIDATGRLMASGADVGTVITSANPVADGRTHHAAAVWVPATGVLSLYLDGGLVGTANASSTGYSPYNFTGLRVGGTASASFAGVLSGTISHVACYHSALTSDRIASHYTAGTTGFSGETSDMRIARYARWAGIPTAEQVLEFGQSTSITFVDTTGVAPVQAMQDVTSTESGVLQIDGQGRLEFQSRAHRYNATQTTLAGVVDPSARFVQSDLNLRNDVTASRPGGITYRAISAGSIADYGTYSDSADLLTTFDTEVIDAANWKANQNAAPESRPPNLTVEILTRPSLQSSILALNISSRILVTLLPTQAPAASADLFIEGWTETISDQAWVFVFNTSPADTSNVWQLDSASNSQLDATTRLAY